MKTREELEAWADAHLSSAREQHQNTMPITNTHALGALLGILMLLTFLSVL